MKRHNTLRIGAAALLIFCAGGSGCRRLRTTETEEGFAKARMTILRQAVRERNEAEAEVSRLAAERNRLILEKAKLEGRVIVLQAEADHARSQVSNAFKEGRAFQMQEEIFGR